MASKATWKIVSEPDPLITQNEWVAQINDTRIIVRECKRCFALYDVKNPGHNCPVFSHRQKT